MYKRQVSTIIPDGVEPHDFELKPENMKQLATAQVFVYNGFGMEPWAKQAIEAAKNDKLCLLYTSACINIHCNKTKMVYQTI